jgi:hypothetical protein
MFSNLIQNGINATHSDYLPEPAALHNLSQDVLTTCESCFLVAATLAASHGAAERTLNSNKFRVHVQLLHSHCKRVARSKADTSAELCFQGMEDLAVANKKVLEFCLCFASM